MDVLDEIIEFFKRKARVRRFNKYRELLEICDQISSTGKDKKGQIKVLKDLIRLALDQYGISGARAQILVLKYRYVDGISRSQLKAWGTPDEFL